MDIGATSSVQAPVMRDVARMQYDLSHWSMKCGAIGNLQTLSVIPVVAGDSFDLKGSFVFRLSPLRRNLYLDCRVDLFAFYIPHRHIYGANWVDFMKAGSDESVTLGTDTLAGNSARNYDVFGYSAFGAQVVPRWLDRGYIQIWNRYFRDPSDVAGILSEDYFVTEHGDAIPEFGLKCCHLKKIWNSAILSTLSTADYRLDLAAGSTVDLYELAALKGRLRSETARDFFATRYQDLLKHTFDSRVNIDADQRPELIMRTSNWLSGVDVDGTAGDNLGTYSGKATGISNISFPTKFFPEHGALWIMGLVRFPPVVYNEGNYLVNKPEPTYAQISGDPDIIRRTAPISLLINDVISTGGLGTVVGKTPFAQWYREQPSLVHTKYFDTLGHPFIDFAALPDRNQAVYISNTLYDNVFQSLQLKHWNSQGFISCNARRFIPDVRESIFAGTE